MGSGTKYLWDNQKRMIFPFLLKNILGDDESALKHTRAQCGNTCNQNIWRLLSMCVRLVEPTSGNCVRERYGRRMRKNKNFKHLASTYSALFKFKLAIYKGIGDNEIGVFNRFGVENISACFFKFKIFAFVIAFEIINITLEFYSFLKKL